MKKLFLIFAFSCTTLFSATHEQLLGFSNKIDSVLEKQYTTLKVSPNTIVNDDTFVRRSYLSIIGRNPTYSEYEAFVKVVHPAKRQELIKFLIKHPGFVSHQFNFWANTLRLRDRLNTINNFSGGPYIDYIKDSIAANKPYDQFVRDLLLSTGSYYDNPAVGYYYRDVGMPMDNLIATGKVFIGVDIGCAQCHDDPFQDFTQLQFYKMAALFNQVELRDRSNKEVRDKFKSLRDQIETLIKSDPIKYRGLNNQVNNFVRATQTSLELTPTKQLKLPTDYQYSNAKPGEVVEPAVLTGKITIKSKEDMRVDAANWFINPQHETFTKNIINRYWNWVFGKYIINEYDNIHDSSLLNSELIDVLAKIMVAVNYDTKQFLFTLYNTKLFQRELYDGSNIHSERFTFIGPIRQRLSAEQIWDSVLALAVEMPESFKLTFQDEYVKVMKVGATDLNLESIQGKIKNYQDIMRAKYDNAPKYKNFVLVRASEVNDYNPTNTILEQLGRSDRELIDTSSREGSVTQVISFMNGQLADIAINKETYLTKNLAGKSVSDRVDTIFKSVLVRQPSLQEKSKFVDVQDDDLIWALINSTEFKFNK